MKKIVLTTLLALMAFTVSANSVRYFTRNQASRVADMLDAQSELMIYCGYEYELATYVIINEVWAEPVNSKFYEIWLYGYDAYTGEEIYMPLDLACVWLFNPAGSRIYSAAQYLRFRTTVAAPNFYWTMPPYNPFVRHYHDPMFNRYYTYHYDIHRFGWRPPAPPHSGPWPYHPYYMRTPHTPAPVPPKPFTPGYDHPVAGDGHGYIEYNTRNTSTTTGRRSASLTNSKGQERTGTNRSSAGNPGTTNRSSSTATSTGRTSNTQGTTTTSRTTNSEGSTTGRSSSTQGTTTGRSSSTQGTTTGRSSNTQGNTTGRSSSAQGTTTGRSSSTQGTTTGRSSSTQGTTTGRSSSTQETTMGRSSSTDNSQKSIKNTGRTTSSSRSSSTSNERQTRTSSGNTSRTGRR